MKMGQKHMRLVLAQIVGKLKSLINLKRPANFFAGLFLIIFFKMISRLLFGIFA